MLWVLENPCPFLQEFFHRKSFQGVSIHVRDDLSYCFKTKDCETVCTLPLHSKLPLCVACKKLSQAVFSLKRDLKFRYARQLVRGVQVKATNLVYMNPENISKGIEKLRKADNDLRRTSDRLGDQIQRQRRWSPSRGHQKKGVRYSQVRA